MTFTRHVPAAQGELPFINGRLHVADEPATAPNAGSEEVKLTEREVADALLRILKKLNQDPPEPAPAGPRAPKRRLSRAKYDALIARESAAPRSASAVLEAVKAAHPSAIKHPPRDLMRRIKIALLARRLNALGATVREVLSAMTNI
jgi:hypothetical protein